jgi:hypothetical protein
MVAGAHNLMDLIFAGVLVNVGGENRVFLKIITIPKEWRIRKNYNKTQV